MSKTKNAQPEDLNILRGDELDGEPAENPNEPSQVDFDINEMRGIMTRLELDTPPYQYLADMKNIQTHLTRLINFMERPF